MKATTPAIANNRIVQGVSVGSKKVVLPTAIGSSSSIASTSVLTSLASQSPVRGGTSPSRGSESRPTSTVRGRSRGVAVGSRGGGGRSPSPGKKGVPVTEVKLTVYEEERLAIILEPLKEYWDKLFKHCGMRRVTDEEHNRPSHFDYDIETMISIVVKKIIPLLYDQIKHMQLFLVRIQFLGNLFFKLWLLSFILSFT